MAEQSKKTQLIVILGVLILLLIAGVLLFTGSDNGHGPAGGAGGADGKVAAGKDAAASSLAGSSTFALTCDEPHLTATFKLPGAQPGTFRPATVTMLNIPIKLQVLVPDAGPLPETSVSAVSRTWTAVIGPTRMDQLFFMGTKKVVPEAVKLADGTQARLSYGSSFMAPSLSSAEGLSGDLANKGSKAFQVMVTDPQGEIYVTVMGPVERESDLEAICREIAASMTVKRGPQGR